MSGNRQRTKEPCPEGCRYQDSQGYCGYSAVTRRIRGGRPGPDCTKYEPAEGSGRRGVPPPQPTHRVQGYVRRPTARQSLEGDPRVLEMYLAGATDREISEATGWARQTVSRWRQQSGLPGRRRRTILDRETEVIRLYGQGLSDGEIAKSIGCTQSAVLRWRQRTGRSANHDPGWPRGRQRKGENHGNEDHQHDAGGPA